MNTTSSRTRAALLFVCLPLAVLITTSGTGCPGIGGPIFPFPPGGGIIDEDFVTFELVNETDFDVDPGIFIEGSQVDTGELFPFPDVLTLDVECIPGDLVEVDPILFDDVGQVFAANAPVFLEEGFDYFCGDLITVFYSVDDFGTFFVDVAVNDVLLDF